MFARACLLLTLLIAPVVAAQQPAPKPAEVPPQLDRSKPPADRPAKAPEREKIDPKNYPRPTLEKFNELQVATWRKDLKPAIVPGDPKNMRDTQTNKKWWDDKATLTWETAANAKGVKVAQGWSKATWNSTGKPFAEGPWRDDQMHGVWQFFSDQGHLASVRCYKLGKLDGPYAAFAGENLLNHGKYTTGSRNGEWCYFHADGYLQHRVMWVVATGGDQKQWERLYNAAGQLVHLWQYQAGVIAGDETHWVEPKYDDKGRVTNSGTTGRLEIHHNDEEGKLHGWQTYYDNQHRYREFDSWYEHGEQTGPFLTYDAGGKQVGAGEKTKGVNTGAWWSVDAAGERTETNYDEKGMRHGAWRRLNAKGEVASQGEYKNGKLSGTWVETTEASVSTTNYDGETGNRHGEHSLVTRDGKVISKGRYEKGVSVGPWVMSEWLVTAVGDLGVTLPKVETLTGSGDYIAGQRSGAWVWRQADGKTAIEGNYDSGIRTGAWKVYHLDGVTVAAQGEFLLGFTTGPWVFQFDNGSKQAEGAMRIGKRIGKWTEWHREGPVQAAGEYDNSGNATGLWVYHHNNGKLMRRGKFVVTGTSYKYSSHIGEWDGFDESGVLKIREFYTDKPPYELRGTASREALLETTPEGATQDPEKPNGTWVTHQGSGLTRLLVSRGVFLNGEPHGKVQQYYPNGKLGLEGDLFGKNREGLWRFWYDTGMPKEEGTFVANVLNGPCKQWRTDGTLDTEGNYQAGKKFGRWQTYHPDGKQVKRDETRGENEQLDGLLVEYHAKGSIERKGSYTAGSQAGLWEAFYADGTKRSVVTYKAGKLDGLYQTWHANGQMSAERTYVEGKSTGPWRLWHENGQLECEGAFAADKPTGTWKAWYENGKPQYVKQYDEAGNPKGKWTEWKEDGSVEEEEDHG